MLQGGVEAEVPVPHKALAAKLETRGNDLPGGEEGRAFSEAV